MDISPVTHQKKKKKKKRIGEGLKRVVGHGLGLVPPESGCMLHLIHQLLSVDVQPVGHVVSQGGYGTPYGVPVPGDALADL